MNLSFVFKVSFAVAILLCCSFLYISNLRAGLKSQIFDEENDDNRPRQTTDRPTQSQGNRSCMYLVSLRLKTFLRDILMLFEEYC